MLVSHRYKFIYLKTYKSASTSTESYFERFCMPEGEWLQTHERQEHVSANGIVGARGVYAKNANWWNHMPAKALREKLGEDIWGSYFKFCTIRNPFEKCISAFEHLGRNYSVQKENHLHDSAITPEKIRFYEWLKENIIIDTNIYAESNKFILDDFIKFESLDFDIKRVCGLLGLPYEPHLLPSFKSGIRRPEAVIKNLYSPESISFVKSKFDFELKFFNYDIKC